MRPAGGQVPGQDADDRHPRRAAHVAATATVLTAATTATIRSATALTAATTATIRSAAALAAVATAILVAPAPAGAQAVVPLTFRAGPNSPIPTGGDAFAVVKTATRSTPAPGSPSPITTDLAVSNPGAGTAAVLLGDGNGSFSLAPGSPFPAGGAGPTGIAQSGQGYFQAGLPAAHNPYNGSLAVADSASNNVSLLYGNGSGGFTSAPGSPFGVGGTGPTSLGAFPSSSGGQFLAVANSGSGNVSVLSSSSDDTSFSGLTPGSPFPTGLTSPTALAVADFNADHNADLALVDPSGASSANVAVLLGNGQGAFASVPGSPFSSAGARPDAIAVADFNDDGNPDIAVANFASSTVSILLGDGHGHFSLAPGSPFPSGGTGPTGLAAWDFTGAGREDLAVVNGTSSSLALFAGDGSGRLTLEPGFPVATGGSGPASVVAGDLNGDAMGDLAIANRQSHTVSILLNTSTPPAFPLLGSARVHRRGTITLRLQAPAAGMFTTLVSATRAGKEVPYGCGVAQPRGPGPVSVLVVPNPKGVLLFERTRTLRLTTRTLFLRTNEIPPVGAGGGGVRHLASRHRPKKVIVHVARVAPDPNPATHPLRSTPAAAPSATAATTLGADAQKRFGCQPPFPSL